MLKEMKLKDQAKSLFLEAVIHFPWNWSAWLELSALSSESDVVRTHSKWGFSFVISLRKGSFVEQSGSLDETVFHFAFSFGNAIQ